MTKGAVPRLSIKTDQVYRLFYPQVPMIVASKFGKLVAAMPANSCMPISDNPPLLAISIKTGAKTNRVITRSKKFSVNWLDFSDKKIISLLTQENESPDKLSSLNIPYLEVFNSPVLSRAQAYAICEVTSTHDAGDHHLIVGKVLGAMASLDFDENWKFEEYHPILYLGSPFRNPYTRMPRK